MKAITEHTHSITKLVGVGLATLLVAGAAYGTSVSIEPSCAYADAPQVQAQAGSWVKYHGKWWYKYADGTYPASDQVTIKGKTYSFDSAGYMKTGWKLEDGSWHYYKGSGAMATGWTKVKGSWYYMDSEGVMQTGWQKVDGKWYYLKSSGAMKTGWLQDQGSWYYLNSSGAMKTGWVKSGGKWYYMDPADGKMATGKQVISGTIYFLNTATGDMKTGWVEDGGKWYYCNKSGAAKTNSWAGDYYLGSDGTMATSGWVDNGKYYVDGSGKWVKKPSASQLATKPGNSGSLQGSASQGGTTNGSTGSNGSSSTQPSQPAAHEHSWTKVVDVPSYSVLVCACGQEFGGPGVTSKEASNAIADHQQEMWFTGVSGHQASSTKRYKEQSHYECSICGVHK